MRLFLSSKTNKESNGARQHVMTEPAGKSRGGTERFGSRVNRPVVRCLMCPVPAFLSRACAAQQFFEIQVVREDADNQHANYAAGCRDYQSVAFLNGSGSMRRVTNPAMRGCGGRSSSCRLAQPDCRNGHSGAVATDCIGKFSLMQLHYPLAPDLPAKSNFN